MQSRFLLMKSGRNYLMCSIKETLCNFHRDDMFDASKRNRFIQAVSDYQQMISTCWSEASPFEKLLATYGVNKYKECNVYLNSNKGIN